MARSTNTVSVDAITNTNGLRDLLILLCKGCSNVINCYYKLLPVMKCSNSLQDQRALLSEVSMELETGKVRNIGLVASSSTTPIQLYRMLARISDITKKYNTILFMPLEVFLETIVSEYRRLFDNTYRVYVYVTKMSEVNIVRKISSSKTMSAYKSFISVMYYASGEVEVKKLIEKYASDTPPRLCIALDELSYVKARSIVSNHDYRLISRARMFTLTSESYSKPDAGESVELLVLSSNPTSRLHVLYDSSRLVVGHEEGGEEDRDPIKRLCLEAIWKVSLDVILDGVNCFNEYLAKAIRKLNESQTLRSVCNSINISYPTLRKLLSIAEHALGVRLVDTYRGGVKRGGARPTLDALRIVKLYERIRDRIESELIKIVQEECRKLMDAKNLEQSSF